MSRCWPLILLSAASLTAAAQQGDGTDVPITTHVFKPALVAATPDRIAQLQAPPGFSITTFATGLKNARLLAVAPDGTVYLSRRDQGDVLMLRDADRDGRADGRPIRVANRSGLHGIALHEDRLYVATARELFVGEIRADGRLKPLQKLIGDLPDAGQHPNRSMAFGPDGMLYLSVGSTCNACNESNQENATLLRVTPDGSSRTVFATGLRNTIGFDWELTSGRLWGLDHGIDLLGDDVQPEELNEIRFGQAYGWPHIWGEGEEYPQSTPVGGITKEQWRAASRPMTRGYTAHAAPMQLRFYSGTMFPAEYVGDAFATLRGSWNRREASGYEIVRIRFADGEPTAIEPFVTGFLTDGGRTHFARPVGLAIAPDGALLMADDANGVIYRIAWQGSGTAGDGTAAGAGAGAPRATPKAPATAMLEQTSRGIGVPLALQRVSPARAERITVRSPTIAEGEPIPPRHSEYADGVSPGLGWSAVEGARSYAIIVEDPDARPVTPFVHWVAWNIPATTTALPPGLQEQLRLTEPEGVMQGRTSRGTVGWFGPRPPVGDPPHRYRFQVLALDTLLELPLGADRDAVLAAAAGHVLAVGELTGTYQQLVEPAK